MPQNKFSSYLLGFQFSKLLRPRFILSIKFKMFSAIISSNTFSAHPFFYSAIANMLNPLKFPTTHSCWVFSQYFSTHFILGSFYYYIIKFTNLFFWTSNLLLIPSTVFFISDITVSLPEAQFGFFSFKFIFPISNKHGSGRRYCVIYKRTKPMESISNVNQVPKGEEGLSASPMRNLPEGLLDFCWDLSSVEIITPWAKSGISSHITVFFKIPQW